MVVEDNDMNDSTDNGFKGINNLRSDIEKAIDYSMLEYDLTYEEIIGTIEMIKQRLCIDYQIHLDKIDSSNNDEDNHASN